MSPFSADTPFNYAPIWMQDGAAVFSLLPLPLLFFAFGLPLAASLIMKRFGWAAFYGVLAAATVFITFPGGLLAFGAALLLSLPALVFNLWNKDEVRWNRVLPLTTCVAVFAMVALGFPRVVSFEMDRCLANRAKLGEAGKAYLATHPGTLLEVEALVTEQEAIPGCQGPGTSHYILNATETEVLVTCDNLAHQREGLGPARSSYQRDVTDSQPFPGQSDQEETQPEEETNQP